MTTAQYFRWIYRLNRAQGKGRAASIIDALRTALRPVPF